MRDYGDHSGFRLAPRALGAVLTALVAAILLGAPAVAAAATGTLRPLADPDEAPPSAVGLLLATGLLLIVILSVGTATRISRKRRAWHQLTQRQRYGAETERLVAEIGSAWAERNEVRLSELLSAELMGQWSERLASAGAAGEPSVRVDRVDARFVGRELPDSDEDDRVVMHVRARCQARSPETHSPP